MTEQEVHKLITEVKQAFLNQSYSQACAKIKTVYTLHISSKQPDEQLAESQSFIKIIRNYFGWSGKGLATVGIAVGERMNKLPTNPTEQQSEDHAHLSFILQLGKSIFNGNGDPAKLRDLLHGQFADVQSHNSSPIVRPRNVPTV